MRNREDWLIQKLEEGNLSEAVRVAYEAELEAIAESHTRAQANKKLAEERAKQQAEKDKLEALVLREKALADKMSLSYDEWLTLAKSLYTVTENYEVVSIARGPDHQRIWEEESEFHARERVFKLIQYKFYDHFTRGNNFAYLPKKKEVA